MDILNGILYVLVNGCKWKDLPKDLPPYKTVFHYFSKWTRTGLLKTIHDHLVAKTRKFHGNKPGGSKLISLIVEHIKNCNLLIIFS